MAEELSKTNHRLTLLAACAGVIFGFAGAMVKGPELVSLLVQAAPGFVLLFEQRQPCAKPIRRAAVGFVL
ncbi:MAG: hypothetical protein WDO74_06315 [Pseudomonadota bacterium]